MTPEEAAVIEAAASFTHYYNRNRWPFKAETVEGASLGLGLREAVASLLESRKPASRWYVKEWSEKSAFLYDSQNPDLALFISGTPGARNYAENMARRLNEGEST